MSSSQSPPLDRFAFLPLAPVQSDSYPSVPQSKASMPGSSPQPITATPSGLSASTPETAGDETTKSSRSSSVSSSTTPSSGGVDRFLKLGPVHFGGEPGVGDYAMD